MRTGFPSPVRAAADVLACVLPLLAAGVGAASAQSAGGITGFTPAGAARQHALEERLLNGILPAGLDSFSYALTREPHVAGSAAQARQRDRLLGWTRAWGLRSEVKRYRVFLPWATSASLRLTAPDTLAFQLREEPLPRDSTTSLPQYPWVTGYSAPGEVEQQVVYANLGLPGDYALLDSLGVSVRGRVVVARYGRAYRGIKAMVAQQHGAAALLLYPDPEEDGYVVGDVYPDGPFRNPTAPQRGSLLSTDGDPTTPGRPSLEGVQRIPLESAGLPRIPVVAISYEVAQEILSRLGPAELPRQEWEGGLPFRYHVGPGPATVHLRVQDDRDAAEHGLKDIWDTFAWIPGADRPDEWVVIGAHADAWGTGANDNASGVASVLSVARAVAERVRAGERPRRTIVFATWDGEEWGLIGSVEWVEDMARQLGARAVAYLNQDDIAGGNRFWAGATPALKSLLRAGARVVPAPEGGSLYERWAADAFPAETAQGQVALNNLGGGSDFLWFSSNAGVPSAAWGFAGGSGEYHSAYDSYSFVLRFADPGFLHHAAAARMLAVAATRLANADVLPYDYAEAGRELAYHARRLRAQAVLGGAAHEQALVHLEEAFRRMELAGDSLAAARDAFLAAPPVRGRTDVANQELLRVERSMLRPGGLQGRPWARNLMVTVDMTNGYADVMLPGVAEALARGDAAATAREAADLTTHVDEASTHLRRAAQLLTGK